MSIDSILWICASESIVSGIETLHKELKTGPDALDQFETYTDACKSMALQGAVMKKGSEAEGSEALGHWNGLYTDLQKSVSTPPEDDSILAAKLLASGYSQLKQLTERFIQSGTDPEWVKNTIKAVRVDAISVRKIASSDMLEDVKTLCSKYDTSCTYEESKLLDQLSRATEKYADRAQKVNGPTVDLITTGVGGESHRGLEHADASQFMGAMSYALRITKLDPLTASSTFNQGNHLINSISDSVLEIETATNNILFAHQELDDTGKEQYGVPARRISMTQEELWDAQLLYKKAVVA